MSEGSILTVFIHTHIDCYIGPHGIDVRIDFINGVHHSPPLNTFEERQLQARDSLDVMAPHHKVGAGFDERRDSISLRKYGDGHVEGMIHDVESGEVIELFAPADVKATMAMLDEWDDGLEQLTVARPAVRLQQLDRLATV